MIPDRASVWIGTERQAAEGEGRYASLGVEVWLVETLDGWSWWIANRGDEPVEAPDVSLAWVAGPVGDRPVLFRNGYQSWSATGPALLGVDDDPARAADVPWLSLGMHHADPAVPPAGELRSELVAMVDAGTGDTPLLVGALGATEHDTTVRALAVSGRLALRVQAVLGGAVLQPGEQRRLHDVTLEGDLASWAARAGADARTTAPFQVGWCSWYQYFHGVTEADIRANLALAGDWPFEVFQVDDRYQSAIGDWLTTNDRFPAGIEALAAGIAGAGVTPGIWLAPFLVAPDSVVAAEHPDWIARHPSGRELIGMVNAGWGGPVWTLDVTHPEVLDHIERTAAALVAAGYPYLKLDFTYAAALRGEFADRTWTPAQRVRRAMEAVRRGAGDDAFLLGCGLPLGAGIGVVDGMRIGPDVAPWWDVQDDQWHVPGHEDCEPATVNAWRNTRTRSWMHRRLWLNDPDCLMLRTTDTRMTAVQVDAWAETVGASGGMALVSDDLSLLGPDARRRLDEVLAVGRAADDEAMDGRPVHLVDVLDPTAG